MGLSSAGKGAAGAEEVRVYAHPGASAPCSVAPAVIPAMPSELARTSKRIKLGHAPYALRLAAAMYVGHH
jgi:hypothetical protein